MTMMINPYWGKKNENEANTNEYIFNIDTSLGTGATFEFRLKNGYNYNFIINWGDGLSSHVTEWNDYKKSHTYVNHGQYTITLVGLVEAFSSFSSSNKSKLLSVEINASGGLKFIDTWFSDCSNLVSFITNNGEWCKDITHMGYTFSNCINLLEIDVSDWVTFNFYNLYGVFYNCSSLKITGLSNWVITNIIDIGYMLYNSPGIEHDYDNVLISWALQDVRLNRHFDAGLAKYTNAGEASRDYLVNIKGWTITDGGKV